MTLSFFDWYSPVREGLELQSDLKVKPLGSIAIVAVIIFTAAFC